MAQFFKAKHKADSSNRAIKVTIEQFNHDGQGIGYVSSKSKTESKSGKSDDKICFVEGALPGEQVQAKVFEDKAKFIKAQTTKVLTPSELRISPECPHFSRCGGCQLQYVNRDSQLALKREAVDSLFKRFANLDSLPWQSSLTAEPWHYRRAARIGVWCDRKSGQFTVGFRQSHSKQITPIDACMVLAAGFENLFTAFAQLLPQLKAGRAVTHLEVVQAAFEGESEGERKRNVVSIRHTQPLTKADIVKIRQLAEANQYSILSEYEKGQFSCLTEAQVPPLHYYLPAQDLRLAFRMGDFIQVNASLNQQMIEQAIDWLELNEHDTVLDLFCGIGNFSLPLAKHCKAVVGIEGVDKMVEQASYNAQLNGLDNVSFYQADLSASPSFNYSFNYSFNKVLLDPARAGAAEAVAALTQPGKGKSKNQPEKILYVSCEPLTLARDSFVLVQSGYRLAKVALMDMFSQTKHVEVMALFIKSK